MNTAIQKNHFCTPLPPPIDPPPTHRIIEEMSFLAVHRTLYLTAVPVQLVERHLRVDVVVEVLHLEHLHKTTHEF